MYWSFSLGRRLLLANKSMSVKQAAIDSNDLEWIQTFALLTMYVHQTPLKKRTNEWQDSEWMEHAYVFTYAHTTTYTYTHTYAYRCYLCIRSFCSLPTGKRTTDDDRNGVVFTTFDLFSHLPFAFHHFVSVCREFPTLRSFATLSKY